MSSNTHEGGCHCGHVRWRLETAKAKPEIAPRACDCDFCSRHHAAWVSDPDGQLRITAKSSTPLSEYRQGSGQAAFLVCPRCGVLVAVTATTTDGRLLGAVNRYAFDERDGFGDETVVSPHLLAADAKLSRWTQLWAPVELRQAD